VEVLQSALRHGVEVEEIEHAFAECRCRREVAEDPIRYLVLGPDPAGCVLELIVMDRPQGPAVIHAMPMRPKYRHQFPESP
jgi:hypothetical protein